MFHEFQVWITMTDPRHGFVWVDSSEFGKTSHQPIEIPHSQPQPASSGSVGIRRDFAPEKDLAPLARNLGTQLGEALFQGELGLCYQKAISHQKPLRFRLDLSAQDLPTLEMLHNLPWEMLRDRQGRNVFLQGGHSLIRKTALPAACCTPVRGRMRVLLLNAAPRNLANLNLNEELENTRRHLRKLGAKVTHLPKPGEMAIARSSFFDALEQGQHVLHFMGHSGLNELCFTDKHGLAVPVTAEELATDLLNIPESKRPRVAFFNSCSSGAQQRTQHSVCGTAETVHKAGIPVVVAMRQPVADAAAIAFSEGFYQKLACGANLDAAVSFGRLRIHQATDAREEWHIPMLYSSLKSTALFQPLLPPKAKALAAAMGLFVLTFLTLWFLRTTTPTLALSPLQLGPTLQAETDLWQESLGMKSILAQAGFQIQEAPLSKPPTYRLEQDLSADSQGTRLQGLVTSASGSTEPKTIVLYGPAHPNAHQIAMMKLEMIDKFLQALGSNARLKRGTQEAMTAYLEGLRAFDQDKLQAIRAFEKALHFDPNHLPARNNLALAQLRVGQKEAAEETIAPLLDQPLFAQVALNAALILKANGKFDAAEAQLRKAIQGNPGFLDAYLELGILKLDQKHYSDALGFFEKAVGMNPQNPSGQKYLGRTYLHLNAWQDARTTLKTALSLYKAEDLPDTPRQLAETHFFLAKLHHLQHENDLARFHLRQVDLGQLWEFRQEAEGLGEALQYPLDWSPSAIAVFVSGYVLIQNKGTLLKSMTQLSNGDQLAISENAHLTLVCKHGFKMTLNGPATWDAAAHETFHTEPIPPWIFRTLLAQETSILSAGNLLKAIPTRNEEHLYLLSPRNATFHPRPTLTWLASSIAEPFVLTLQITNGTSLYQQVSSTELEHTTLTFASQTLHLLQTPWPESWPNLEPEHGGQIRIRDGLMHQGTAMFSVLSEADTASLQQRLTELEALGLEAKTDLLADLYFEFHCAGPALRTLLQPIAPNTDFALANSFLRAGILDLAAKGFAFELSRTEDVARRIHCLVSLGRIRTQQQRYEEARTSLLNARGLMPHPTPLRDEVDHHLETLPIIPPAKPVKKEARQVLPF